MTEKGEPIRFGFLPFKWEIEFEFGRIVPVANFDKALQAVEGYLHEDGYLYPQSFPDAKRPSRFLRLPPSHEIFFVHAPAGKDVYEGIAGLVMHYLALLFSTRLQFAGWLFDGRIPMQRSGKLVRSQNEAGNELSHACRAWSSWSGAEQRRFITLLYMHSRAASYEWDWEEFAIRYMVLDSLWKMGETILNLKANNHRERITVLCESLSVELKHHSVEGKVLSELRNSLFHEALWQSGRPGSGKNIALMYGTAYPIRMKYLTEQLIRTLVRKAQN